MLSTLAPWLALAIVTIVLVVALRKRWKRTSILMRCVIVSLYAHLFLAAAACTMHFASWRPGPGGAGSGSREVRVRLASESPDIESAESDDTLPPWESVGEVPLELASLPDSSASKPSDAPEVVEPPPLEVTLPTPSANPFESIEELIADVAPRYADEFNSAPQPTPEPPRTSQASDVAAAMPEVRPTSPAAAARPELYQLRFADRGRVLESAGGNADTEAAVQLALVWLVANQEADGHWSAARHGAGRGAPQQGQDRGDTGADADTGITALAVLALLGAGHTHLEGEHREAVQHGLEFLLASQRANGSLAGEAKLFAAMYCHGMATLAIAEALAVTNDERLRPFVERAVAFSVAAQHSGGGWRYQPGDVGDMSQFGWQIMALKSAELAGVTVPKATSQRAERFLAGLSSGRSGGLSSYRSGERASRTMTAEALVCRYLLTQTPAAATQEEAAAFVLQELPGVGQANVYYWYYGTMAMRFAGGQSWDRWNAALQRELLQTQRTLSIGPERHLAGSWDPDRIWGGYGGRVYQTSLSALCLESYYRYSD
jgi:hypothetical protein